MNRFNLSKIPIQRSPVPWFLLLLNTVWFQLSGYSSFFDLSHTAIPYEYFPIQHIFIVSCFLAALLITIFSEQVQKILLPISITVACSTVLGSLFFAFSGYQALFNPVAVSTVSSCAIALSFVWTQVIFFKLLKEYAKSLQTVVFFIMTIGLSAIIAFFFESIPSVKIGVTLFLLISLLLSALQIISTLLIKDGTPLESDIDVKQMFNDATHDLSYKQAILKLFASSVAVSLMRAISSAGLWGTVSTPTLSSTEMAILFLSLILFAAVSYSVYFFMLKNQNLDWMQLPLLVLVIGFFLILGIRPVAYGQIGYSLLELTVEWYCNIISYIIILSALHTLQFSAYRIAGFATALSFLLSIIWMFLLNQLLEQIDLIILMAVFLLMITMLFAKPFRQINPGVTAHEPPLDYLEMIRKTSEMIALDFGLTNREREVFYYLAQGRSMPYIENELKIANATVRTHVRNIYQKLNINSKQELLDIVERFSKQAGI